jgi:large subunit ribosomal protein L18
MTTMTKIRQQRRERRKLGLRKHVLGSAERPRLTVFRSHKHIYAQIVDDLSGRTLVSASTAQAKMAKGGNKEAAGEVGKLIAERAKAAGISQVMFDRNGFRYHGRVQSLAEAARKTGLKF